jgi:hypothetical protein
MEVGSVQRMQAIKSVSDKANKYGIRVAVA